MLFQRGKFLNFSLFDEHSQHLLRQQDTENNLKKFYEFVYNNNKYCHKFVQEAVFQCVQRLNDQRPDTRVGLITFNDQVKTPARLVSYKNSLY